MTESKITHNFSCNCYLIIRTHFIQHIFFSSIILQVYYNPLVFCFNKLYDILNFLEPLYTPYFNILCIIFRHFQFLYLLRYIFLRIFSTYKYVFIQHMQFEPFKSHSKVNSNNFILYINIFLFIFISCTPAFFSI